MSHASYELRVVSDNPETIAQFSKVVQTFLADHPDAAPEFATMRGVPVSIDEAMAQLFLQRDLPMGGEHLVVLDGDNTPVVELGLTDHVLAVISQPGVISPTDPDRRTPLLTVGELAHCGAHTLLRSWTRLQSAAVAEIIDRLAAYATNLTAQPAKPAPSHDFVTT
jgi:hypothetical protein